MDNQINTDKVLNDTKRTLLMNIDKTKVFLGNLLAKTGDTEGYTYAVGQLDDLKDYINGN